MLRNPQLNQEAQTATLQMESKISNDQLASIQSLPSGQSAMPLVVDEAEESQKAAEPASKTSVIAANLKPKTNSINQVFLQKRNQQLSKRN